MLPAAIPLEPPGVDKACGTWFAGWLSSYQYRYQEISNSTLTSNGGSWGSPLDHFDSDEPLASTVVLPPDNFDGVGDFPRPDEYTQQRVVCFAAGVLQTCALSVAVSVTSCPNDIRYTVPATPAVGFHGGAYCADIVQGRTCGPTPSGRITIDGVCRNGGAWHGMLCPLLCPERHHWSRSSDDDVNSTVSVDVRCVDGEWRSAVDHDTVPQCVPNPCASEPTFIPHSVGSRSQCTGTLSGQRCSFQCAQGYTPSTTATCYQGDWRLADAAAAGGGCRANNATVVSAADENGIKWYEVLGYVGDWMPLLPLLLVLGIFLLVTLAYATRWLCRWQRAQAEAERARSCRPIDSVGFKFTLGAKRFGSLPPIITDPKERVESRNLATYTPKRGVPGAIGGGEALPGQGRRLPQMDSLLDSGHPPSHPETDWVPPTEEPSKWLSGSGKSDS